MSADEQPIAGSNVTPEIPTELAEIVRAGVKAARLVPGAVALGGTTCSLYARHRLSLDIDFVVADLSTRFDQVKELLEAQPNWTLERVKSPVLILGSLDHVPIGYRQLRRPTPLEQTNLQTLEGPLPIPTLPELLRIKAVLACDRCAVRDFYDFAELSLLLPRTEVLAALGEIDAHWSSAQRPGVALEVMKSLADCSPRDDPATVFGQFRFLQPRVTNWGEVQRLCREIAADLSVQLME